MAWRTSKATFRATDIAVARRLDRSAQRSDSRRALARPIHRHRGDRCPAISRCTTMARADYFCR
jgi:hypothetical protein